MAWRANVDGLGATGPLQVVHELGTAAGALVCTQLTGGPAPDIALAYHDGGPANVRLFQNNLSGFGSPQTRGYGAPGAGLALLAGDMDQNGHTDLVAMDGAGNLTVLANDGGDPGSWGIHAVGSTQPEARLQLIDVDGDGDLDLFATGGLLLEWFENVSTIADVQPFVAHPPAGGQSNSWGHATHLGCGEEMAVLHYYGLSNWVRWLFYDPDVHDLVQPGDGVASDIALYPDLLATADVNGDGRVDMLRVGWSWDGKMLKWYANEMPTEVDPLELAPLGPVCATGDPVDLNDMASLPAGLWWNGPDGLGTMFDPASTGLGVHTLTCHVTDPCPRSAQTTIEVVAPVLEEASGTPYDIAAPCAMDPLVFAATPPGGTWSGMADPNGVVVRSCASRPNWGAVAYTVDLPGLGSCTGYSEVMILPACIPISLGPDTVLCTNSDLLAVPVQPFGEVTLSGFDTVTWEHVPPASPTPTGWFDPDKAPGTYMLTAMVTGTGNCPGHDTMYIHVAEHEFIDITITPVDTLCRFGDPYPLSGHATPTGGNWSGPGVQDGVFTPPGEGSFTVYYGFAESCAYAPVTIEVIEEPTVVAVSGNPDAMCEIEPLVYAATPAGGTWGGRSP